MKRKIFLTLLFFILFSCGVKPMQDKIVLDKNTLKMKQELLKLIPINSEIQTAEVALKKNSFQTEFMKNSDFMESNPEQNISRLHSKIDYLYASLEKSSGLFSGVSERWQIAVRHHSGKVTDIYISYGKTGL